MRLALLLLLAAAPAGAARYEIDPDASIVEFRVRHLIVNRVGGRFGRVGGSFEHVPGKPESWRAAIMIDASSIDTGIKARDEHLRSEDFLFVSSHPAITFLGTRAEPGERGAFTLRGELTIRGVTRPAALEVTPVETPGGRLRFRAKGSVDRVAHGVGNNDKHKAGSAAIGRTVEVTIEVAEKAP